MANGWLQTVCCPAAVFYTKLADLDPERSSVRISVAREVASLYSRGMSMHMNLVQGGNDCFPG